MALYDDFIKHKILVQRYARKQANDLQKDMISLRNDIIKEIDKYGFISYPQIEKMRKALTKSIDPIFARQLKQLTEFYNYEARFSAKVLKKDKKIKEVLAIPEAKVSKIKKTEVAFSLNKEPVKIQVAYSNYIEHKINKVVTILKDNEHSTENVTEYKKVTSDAVRNLFAGAVAVQGLALVTTVINNLATDSRTDVIDLNDALLEVSKVVWTSVLDEVTCPDCEDLDGQEFDFDDYPDCPQHANCRCEVVPS